MSYRSLIALLTAVTFAAPACAAIGKIGSKGGEEEATSAPAAPSQEAPAMTPAQKVSLLTIRFTQKRVYFDRALRQAVEATERTRPGAYYTVISYVPAGETPAKSERINQDAARNVSAVVQGMQNLGVTSDHIIVKTEQSEPNAFPEVRLYIN